MSENEKKNASMKAAEPPSEATVLRDRLVSALERVGFSVHFGDRMLLDMQIVANAELKMLEVTPRNRATRRFPFAEVERLCGLLLTKRDTRGQWHRLSNDDVHDVFNTVLLSATGRHRGLFQDGSFEPLSREIARIERAIEKRHNEIQRLDGPDGPPSTRTSDSFQNALIDRNERASLWLRILLLKRNEPGDAETAEAIRCSAWP